METNLHPVNVKLINENTFKILDDDFMLITAGNKSKFNTMTASWGSLGILWNKPVATCFVRPKRYTFGFMNSADFFTLSFFDNKYKSVLNYLGNTSGRNVDKIDQSKLTPVFTKNESIYFSESRLVFECRKIYIHDLNPENFVQPGLINEIYPTGNFHRMYIGEIVNCLINKSSD